MNYKIRWKFTNRPDDTAWKEYVGNDKKDINEIFRFLSSELRNFSSNTTYDFDVVMKEETQ